MKNQIDRRQFLARSTAAAFGFPFVISSSALGRGGVASPNDKIVMGCIGFGNRGEHNTKQFLMEDDVRVVAVCDVFAGQRKKAMDLVNDYYNNEGCTAYNDFRKLMAREDIDAVSIAVPDHWHVLIGLAAARAGKDMYFEKPVGVSFEQAIALRSAIREKKNVFQFGTQQRSSRNFRFACELARNARVGDLKTIYVGAPASWAIPQDPTIPVPEDLDYDMWLGPAPWAPYSYQRCRPYNDKESYSTWYHIHDYCLGFIANWGVHHLDIAQWGNGTDDATPISVEGHGEFPQEGIANCCVKWELEFHYANGVKLIYTDNKGKCKQGVKFEGSEGWVHVNRQGIDANPKSILDAEIGADGIHLYESEDHHRNFLDCVKSRKETICPIETAVHSDTLCQLSNIATRLDRKLNWDPVKEQFVNNEEANKMLSRPMCAPWSLKG
ncbi:MAG: gfo/Idh/MocA family oxidoreductase [Candidatus Omnitrophota bacterium]|jgi:predicted dehydrogenase|nr:MAG: gfo/Idh/MocA family oxidoreductase [Candidatus Omnitrophota bacterium]